MIELRKTSTLPRLTAEERKRFQELKREMVDKMTSALVEVGEALKEIRDKKLYREDYDTFEALCRDAFNISRSNAYRLMEAAEVSQDLSSARDKPTSIRQLTALAKVEPEKRKEVFEKLKQGGPVTAKRVRTELPDPKPKRTCPTCGRPW